MKSVEIAGIIAASATFVAAMPAAAQSLSAPNFYGTLGYTYVDANDVNLGAVTGRLGARLHRNFGVEGEAAIGVDSDRDTLAGVTYRTKLKHSFAGYGVAYLPLSPQVELFARGGYGTTRFRLSTNTVKVSDSDGSWNYGAGGQYLFDANNGLRAEYTRYDFGDFLGHANTWSLSYVRKF